MSTSAIENIYDTSVFKWLRMSCASPKSICCILVKILWEFYLSGLQKVNFLFPVVQKIVLLQWATLLYCGTS